MQNVIHLPTKPLVKASGISKHNKYISILSKMAVAVEPVAQARIAAAIVIKNNIISFGINQKKSHPFQAMYGKNSDCIYLHAEIDAIKNALRIVTVDELSRSILYVCRVKYDGDQKSNFIFGLSKPCQGCSRAIANFNIKQVYYSLDTEGYEKLWRLV